MNILLISQCNKRALPETRRILDQFGERRGDRVWQTAITQQGMETLRKMLKKTARRNTAVACHWIRSKDHSELIWVVGNARKFNENGAVPTNTTQRDVLRSADENGWHSVEAISLLSGIAGLFHDFGKANTLFQKKLRPKAKLFSEPYRHEWVSLRLFQAFVGSDDDHSWVQRLATVSPDQEAEVLARLIKDSPKGAPNPFCKMPPLARVVGWLIVSHHRLPKYTDGAGTEPKIDRIKDWLTHSKILKASWNSPQCTYDTWKPEHWQKVWEFPQGTPVRSVIWCSKAKSLAKRALKLPQFIDTDWLQDRFTAHLARLTLMLADHCYSASQATTGWQDKKYKAYANTDRKTRALKQKLDEHNIGVGHNAVLLSKSLPKIRQTLPAITRHKGFKQRSKDKNYRWQDQSYDLARAISDRSQKQGFFGVNMASTGKGKTFANARIMYGLADEKLGCRFSVALGLRTLTLQTGDALQERLHLSSDDLAVLIGSAAVRDLHRLRQAPADNNKSSLAERSLADAGSESAESLFAEHQYVRYDGSLDDGRLSRWLKQSPKLHQLLSAPVLVSTIDHLIPATEGERGGKQIAPMLRLLTSDLVLDEPDDFGLDDLPALSRLVNWAGMLGTRILLSSATLPPALIHALFDAYRAGRESFNSVCGEPGRTTNICCAWFDENGVAQQDHAELQSFQQSHKDFVEKRISKLSKESALRCAALWDVHVESTQSEDVVTGMSDAIRAAIFELHQHHHQTHEATQKQLSIGLVRMANITPMIAIVKAALARSSPENCRIHFCVYHSQHPLMVRSDMEAALDAALSRHDPDALWCVPAIKNALESCPEKNQIFIVFATPVAEVGRDHDYDWAIAEPSSMRSIIQLAGRIQRHRQQAPQTPNLLLLSKNYKALKAEPVAFVHPGFENTTYKLKSHNLHEILTTDQYQYISAIPRIQARADLNAEGNLVDLEHAHLTGKLFGGNSDKPFYAALWWAENVTWSAEMQRHDRFRESSPDEEFVLLYKEEGEPAQFNFVDSWGELNPVEKSRFQRVDLTLGERVQPWLQQSAETLIETLADTFDKELEDASKTFAVVRLREQKGCWWYHEVLGIFRDYE
ncbi:MAG: type I-F CRISPR-associated helicase Cas3f [Pontibacterium sp.]